MKRGGARWKSVSENKEQKAPETICSLLITPTFFPGPHLFSRRRIPSIQSSASSPELTKGERKRAEENDRRYATKETLSRDVLKSLCHNRYLVEASVGCVWYLSRAVKKKCGEQKSAEKEQRESIVPSIFSLCFFSLRTVSN